MEIDFDEETDQSTGLNRKDITSLVTGRDADDVTDRGDGPDETPADESLNPVVGILDMLIVSSRGPLTTHGYPAPNTEIWEEWGKPNLSKALNHYMPTTAGVAVNSPAFAGLIGFGALVIAFLPVFLHYVEKRKQREAEEAAEAQPAATTAPATHPTAENRPDQGQRIQTADQAAAPQIVKLPGGGDEATPAVPMMELIARNMATGGEMPI